MILLLFCTFVATNSGSKLLLDLNGKKYTLLCRNFLLAVESKIFLPTFQAL